MAREFDSLETRIRDILFFEWDPNNASRSEAAKSIYDDDVGPIASLLRGGANEEALVEYLYDRERSIMCFAGLGRQRLRRVAQLLLTAYQQ